MSQSRKDMTDQLAFDHKVIEGARATRRYFSKFERIISHMGDVAALSYKEKQLSPLEARIVLQYFTRPSAHFHRIVIQVSNGQPGRGSFSKAPKHR